MGSCVRAWRRGGGERAATTTAATTRERARACARGGEEETRQGRARAGHASISARRRAGPLRQRLRGRRREGSVAIRRRRRREGPQRELPSLVARRQRSPPPLLLGPSNGRARGRPPAPGRALPAQEGRARATVRHPAIASGAAGQGARPEASKRGQRQRRCCGSLPLPLSLFLVWGGGRTEPNENAPLRLLGDLGREEQRLPLAGHRVVLCCACVRCERRREGRARETRGGREGVFFVVWFSVLAGASFGKRKGASVCAVGCGACGCGCVLVAEGRAKSKRERRGVCFETSKGGESDAS